jgi:hypothetical protein
VNSQSLSNGGTLMHVFSALMRFPMLDLSKHRERRVIDVVDSIRVSSEQTSSLAENFIPAKRAVIDLVDSIEVPGYVQLPMRIGPPAFCHAVSVGSARVPRPGGNACDVIYIRGCCLPTIIPTPACECANVACGFILLSDRGACVESARSKQKVRTDPVWAHLCFFDPLYCPCYYQ